MAKRSVPKVVATVCTSSTLLLALGTSPVGAAGAGPVAASVRSGDRPLIQAQEALEKVLVRNGGDRLVFEVVGKPGRHCAVLGRAAGRKDWVRLVHRPVLTGRSGVARLTVPLQDELDTTASYRIYTAADARLEREVRSTEVFEVTILGHRAAKLAGVRSVNECRGARAGTAVASLAVPGSAVSAGITLEGGNPEAIVLEGGASTRPRTGR